MVHDPGSGAAPVSSSCSTALLRHKTAAFELLESVALAPLQLLLGAGASSSSASFDAGADAVTVELFHSFVDDVRRPCARVDMEVRHAGVDFGRAVLRIHAHFTGLRALMFHHPVAASFLGIGSISTVVFTALYFFWRRMFEPRFELD